MARTNYSFKKRQKELERQKKQEEKRQRRLAKKEAKLEDDPAGATDENAPDSELAEGENPIPEP